MTERLWERAALNNALWCDAVCATHLGPGEFRDGLWIGRLGAPLYYPDIVTLKGVDAAQARMRAIAEFADANRHRDLAVKDSFQDLDLRHFGFVKSFDASWIFASPENAGAAPNSSDWVWRRVRDEADLARWVRAWGDESSDPCAQIFLPALLRDPDIQFVQAVDSNEIVGGGILNRGAGVLGISNVFARGADREAIWAGLVRFARSAFPGLALVGYESTGRDLTAAQGAGFSALGGLTVWTRGGCLG